MATRRIKRIQEPPQGLVYVPDFISATEELQLIKTFEEMEFYDFVLQGQPAKRKVHHFGFRYEFYSQHVEPIEEFPGWLKEIRDRAAPFAGLKADTIEQALVAKYDSGAGIGWHRDAPAFGATVVGISFAADDVMRFRRTLADSFEHYKQPLARRSLYILSGPARSVWQHSVAPVKELRYSITLRTVKERYRPQAACASS
jgi:DNA oxidative demethylase